MRKVVAFIWLLFTGTIGVAQNLGLSVGYSTYKMDDLKRINNEYKSELTMPPTLTDDFPGFMNFEASLTFPLDDKYIVGGFLGVTSTGSRLAYNDYTGHEYFDQKLVGINVGPSGWMNFKLNNKSSIHLGAKAGVTFTFHTISYEMVVSSNSTHDDINFKSLNIFLEPEVIYNYKIGNTPLGFNLQAGYNINIAKGELKLETDSNAFLTDESGDKVYADWSGVRLFAGIFYSFQRTGD